MKLIRARFRNFRLLRDLTIDFSVDPDKRLTVIRAENKTGKTTILNALQWALYGDRALPVTRNRYRLHHWDVPDGEEVEIVVEVDFMATTTRYNRRSGTYVSNQREFRIIRATSETPIDESGWDRGVTATTLYEYTEGGLERQPDPEARIQEMLSPELRDVFFMDSDRALSFIESDATRSAKRKRVQAAIRSLLGFDVIESAQSHVGATAASVRSKAMEAGANQELEEAESRIREMDNQIRQLNEEMADAEEQRNAFAEQAEEISARILEAVRHGNREELTREIEQAERELKRIYGEQASARKAHSRLFRDSPLYLDLLKPVLDKSFAKLDELSDRGKIPNATIPVLEERLREDLCICGESLSHVDAEGVRRRQHVQHLMEKSRSADDLSKLLTELFYGSTPLRRSENTAVQGWSELYYEIHDRRDSLDEFQQDWERTQKALETRLDDIPDTDIKELRSIERDFEKQRDRFRDTQVSCEVKLSRINRERPALIQKRNRLLREQVQDELILAQRDVTQDIFQILENVYDRITNEELLKVSNQMNTLFLRMLVADPAESADIRRAEISSEFDIRVYSGSEERIVNPDLDLSGASRRALTMAFILSLMNVSEVEAPSVIDTPLGMMSGLIRRSALETAVDEGNQVILFLTRAETDGCEDILSRRTAKFITLTNAAHYPAMLVNDPGVVGSQAIRCECKDLGFCPICEVKEEQTFFVGSP